MQLDARQEDLKFKDCEREQAQRLTHPAQIQRKEKTLEKDENRNLDDSTTVLHLCAMSQGDSS